MKMKIKTEASKEERGDAWWGEQLANCSRGDKSLRSEKNRVYMGKDAA